MDTVETREQVPPQAGLLYDGFISYSHAADDLLAPRLQAGLQRFAKPWWKRRALRMFRDESSLSANPHLWSSITDALDRSAWFVLLLSPEAAQSEWVNQEVEYWVEHKDPERIIPVLTDGDFVWSGGDVAGDAVPPALHGVFGDEPRWVDVRFARAEEQLDLNNPRFSAAVADIASAIRGVPKDELESEEVRQHRRTVRTVWVAGAGLLVLALLAGGAALFARDQRNDARQQAAVAQARELTLEAEKVLEDDPELSSHLALQALTVLREAGEDAVAAESAIRAAIANDRIVLRVPGSALVAVHPDGTLMATQDPDHAAVVLVRDTTTGDVVETYERQGLDPVAVATGAVFSPDGTKLLVIYDTEVMPLTVWDRSTGESFDLGDGPARYPDGTFVYAPVLTPDGELVAFEGQGGIEVWSLEDRALVWRGSDFGKGLDIGPDGLMSYIITESDTVELGNQIRIVDAATGVVVDTFDIDATVAFTQWSPDGSRIAATGRDQNPVVALFDAGTRTEIWSTSVDRAWRSEWLSNDELFVGGESVPKVIDAATGEVAIELTGRTGNANTYDAIPGSSRIASAPVAGGEIVIFDTSVAAGAEITAWEAPVPQIWYVGYAEGGDRVIVSDQAEVSLEAVTARAEDGHAVSPMEAPVEPISSSRRDGALVIGAKEGNCCTGYSIVDTATGEVIYEAPNGWQINDVSWDGGMAIIGRQPTEDGQVFIQWRVVSIPDGATLTDLDYDPGEDGHVGELWRWRFTPDGEQVWGLGWTPEAELNLHGKAFDAGTGERVASFRGGEYVMAEGQEFVPDGSRLLIPSVLGPLHIFDVQTLLLGGSFDDALIRTIDAHDAYLNKIRVSPDGTMVITAAWNEPLRVWDIESGRLIGEFGGELPAEDLAVHDGDFHPTLPLVVVSTPPHLVSVHTLDTDELVTIAESRLSRPMTDGECQQYFRGPCPES